MSAVLWCADAKNTEPLGNRKNPLNFDHMRVILPLFHFQYFEDQEFAFSDDRLSIRRFGNVGRLADREIFSKRDRDYMDQQAHHALVAESDDLSGYKPDATLLLMTFRILGDHRTPIINRSYAP
jgi:hypothetical protein